MLDALADLETLMIKARDMIRLSADLNERLTAISSVASAPDEPAMSILSASTHASAYAPGALIPATQAEDATFIRSSLVQLGLHMENTPVTLDMIRDEKRWHEELARELAGVLQGSGKAPGMMRTRGIIGIDEVWGGWNRARGVGACVSALLIQDAFSLPTHSAYSAGDVPTGPPTSSHVYRSPYPGAQVSFVGTYRPVHACIRPSKLRSAAARAYSRARATHNS
jgi:ESCRT-II complex subunit VPS36